VNRSIITNNQKQPLGYDSEAKLPWGEAFIRRIERKQAIYLGAVHTVLREWIQKGKPRTNEGRHNFSAWVQSVDWIVQNLFLLHPLMDDRAVSQEILSDKTLARLVSPSRASKRTIKHSPCYDSSRKNLVVFL
jgi:hypothetical protein